MDTSDYKQEMERVLAPLADPNVVPQIITYYNSVNLGMVSKDGQATYTLIPLKMDVDEAMDTFPSLRRSLGRSD